MKKHHAMKWIEALRSGKYKQGRRWLCDNGKYCCLGVADEIFPEMNLSNGNLANLPNYHRLGLESRTGIIGDQKECISLAVLNDSGYTFDEIADVIQIEYVEGL